MTAAETNRSVNPIEFDALAHHLRRTRIFCGAEQARLEAQNFGRTFGWDAEALLTEARA